MNTESIECIEDIVIKKPHECSILNEVKTIETYDPQFHPNLKFPPIARYFISETITVRGYLNNGLQFTLILPIDTNKQIEIVVDDSELINEEEEQNVLSAKEAATKSLEMISKHKTEELQKIDKLIKEAIQKGERKCSYDGYISESAQEELERLGYRVTKGTQYNEGYVVIYW